MQMCPMPGPYRIEHAFQLIDVSEVFQWNYRFIESIG